MIMSTAHWLKITSHWFNELSNGKTFEVRKNDRDYKVGDVLNIYVPETMETRSCRDTYVLTAEQFPDGIKEGYAVLGIKEIV